MFITMRNTLNAIWPLPSNYSKLQDFSVQNTKLSKTKQLGLLLHKVFNLAMSSLPCIDVYAICSLPCITLQRCIKLSTAYNSGCANSTFQSDFVSLIEHWVSVLSVIGDIHCINLHCYHLQMVAGQ